MWFPSTTEFTGSLPLQAVFSAVLLLAFLTYKIAWILSSIFVSTLILSTSKDKNEMQRMAKWGLIGKFVSFLVMIVSICVRIGSAFVQTILIVLYSFIPFIVLGFVLMMIQDRWGDSAVMVTSILNDPKSPVAQSIHYLVRVPLQILSDVSFYVIPVYNLIVYVLFHIPIELFSNFIFGDGASLVMEGFFSLGQSISLMVQAVASFIRNNRIECIVPEPTCWNYTMDACIIADKHTIASTCLDTYQRRIDAIPFLTAMMNGFSCILKALVLGCSSMETLINIFCFPLTDPSLWKSIHFLINSILYVIIGAPTTTAARCALGGGFSVRPALCTPDFAPAFEYAVNAAQCLGDVIDNFIDMAFLLVVYGNMAECPRGSLTQHSLFLPVWKDPYITTLFGSNSTSLVTLSSTLFALTDGQHSVYVSHSKDVQRSYYPNAWGSLGVNPRFGIASISSGSAMLGCRCIDMPNEMVIQCSTSAQGLQSASTTSFNSTWEIVEAGTFMQCSSVRIIVQSIRWPEQRIILSEKQTSYQNSKLIADAAVYVIPTCGGDSNSLACLDSRIFTLSNCYPFCLALHTSNSGLQPLLFRGYKSWMEGVLITDRDCVPVGSIRTATGSSDASSSCSSDVSSGNPTISSSSSSDGAMSCNYSPICSSWISNKTAIFNGEYAPSIPAYADTSKFVKNILDGQPLLAAGGMIMRVSESTTSRFVDFPVITGNQYNDFSLEVASPAGIPVAPLPPVISLSVSSEKKGFISLPPRYIEMVDIYNPATLSPNALWYAVNPSYDWLTCFATWCASEGRDTCVQIMFLSSYTPIRLWKVYYKSSACFIRANDGVHVCREDVAEGFSLDKSRDLPLFSSLNVNSDLGSLCSSVPLTEFNLWVENMEYYDEFNIAVSVRRGSIKALHNLMQNVLVKTTKVNQTASEWYKANDDYGRIVIYFIHTLNTSLVRALEPWTSVDGIDPGFLSVVHGSAVLCPELRFLPSFGSFVSHSFASVLYGIKMPVNLLCNFFALSELLTARANHACPSDGLGHSAIEDCGMGLFDLTPFFNAIEEGNKAFWSILAWVATLLQSQSTGGGNAALEYFESFVTGVAVYGEAGHIVSLFQVTDIAETMLDTGVQDFIMGGGGQRRLLVTKEDMAKMAKSAGKSGINGIMNVFTSGVKTVFSISESLSAATAGKMGSVDFGILLSSTNPTYILGSLVSAPAIVWAQFTYETVLPITLDLASSILYAKTIPNSTAIIWVRLHEAKDNYMKLIEPRMIQGCGGLRLMLGYSGGLPTAIYHNCISASKMHMAMFSLTTLVLSEVPFYSCMCVKSNGYPFPDYIINNCMEWVPVARKGLWQSIIMDSGQDAQKLCKWYGDYIHNTAMHMFDDWTYESHMAASSLASFLQDLIVPDAKNLGSCINTQSNPNIFVMLPIPSEHYRICGNTSECHLRCVDAYAMFEYELNRYQSTGYSADAIPQSFDVSAESPFFNMYQSSTDSLYYIQDRILAISSRNLSSSYACSTCTQNGGGCVILAKAQWDAISSLSVSTYCTPPPSSILATVYASGGGDWTFDAPSIDQGFSLTYCNFALPKDDIYLVMGYTSAVMSVNSAGIFSFDAQSAASNVISQQKIYIMTQSQTPSLLLDTDALMNVILSPAIQDYVFEKKTVYNTHVNECRVNDFVEIYSGTKGQLIFFMTIMFTAKGWVKQEDDIGFISDEPTSKNHEIIKSGYVTAIMTWCDTSLSTTCHQHLDLFLPCSCDVVHEIICQNPSYVMGSGCRAGLDKALYLAQRGTFLHVDDNIYLFVPKADVTDSIGKKLLVQYVEISIDGSKTEYPLKAPYGMQYPKHAADTTIKLYTPSSSTKEQIMRQELGFWSHSDVFSLSGLTTRILRSPILLDIYSSPIRWLQAVQPTSTSVQWLRETRITLTNRGFELVSISSQNVVSTARIQTKCSPSNCAACVSASVRLVCHALQDCMLSRCIGTTINYKNILCSVGVVVQQMYLQMVTSWRAVYLFMVELCMFVVNGFGGSISQKIVLSFPTDNFYSLVCACKDVFASFIGMGMSVVESLYGLFTTGRIDISINSYVSPQDAIITTQIRSIGGLFFNIVTDATLYPILALHRWILCITNSTTVLQTTISVKFGDINMDQSWGICTPLSNKLAMLMDASEMENMMRDDVNAFISYSLSLLSGIGDTVLYGMILMFDSTIAFFESIVWNIQNMMQAFNLRSCKVADYMQSIVLQCACGDTPHYIQKSQRESTWSDGALWCSGAMAITLTDGTQGIIYNPYSLQQLSEGLTGITEYIKCLSSSTSSRVCKKSSGVNTLSILTNQGVDPIAVWTKCKSNYMEQSWDIATGALFTDAITTTAMSQEISDPLIRTQAQNWAKSKAPEFLQCLQEPLRFYQDYSTCLKMYLNLTTGRLPNAYFVFTASIKIQEPPDACLVFSGLNRSAMSGSPLQQTMQHCIMDLSDSSVDPALCQFNPSIWSASDPRKVPVAKLFGILQQSVQSQSDFYKTSIDKVEKAFDLFNKTFAASAKYLEVALFSADGDFIHDFIDCVFLGPYTRVDMLPCDAEGELECPFYARDENGGMHRNFTACFGSVMRGDGALPFTCGSPLRRALIKYFFRDYSWDANNQNFKSKITNLMQQRLLELKANLTDPSSFGCLDAVSGQCSGMYCTKENGYIPCLDMEFAISASNVSLFILEEMLMKMDDFYATILHDTVPWTKYYNLSDGVPLPAQWGKSMGRAREDGLFMPMEYVVDYDQSEVYNMPSHTDPPQQRFEGSVWSLCMGLLSQGQMSLVLDKDGRPLSADDAFLNTLQWYDLDSIASSIRNMTKKASENSPFRWHKARFHAPSQSAVCKDTRLNKPLTAVGSRIRMGPIEFDSGGTTYKTIQKSEKSLPFHGFSWGTIGNAHDTCLCGYQDRLIPGNCRLSTEACESLLNVTKMQPCVLKIQGICRDDNGMYSKTLLSEIWDCLHNHLSGIRCPELGPSDSWGLFPMDCDGQKCLSATQWSGNAQQDVLFEGIRLVTEGRAGLKVSNIEYVNSTYHKAIDYTQQTMSASNYQIDKCFVQDELSKDRNTDDNFDAFQDWVKGLFPAAQAHHESPVIAYCSRYVIEVARAESLSLVSLEASMEALQEAKKWRRKCHSKVKHLTSCARLGVYFNVKPPDDWKTYYTKHCDVIVDNAWSGHSSYMTPWCIVVDQVNRVMYDARLCLKNAMTSKERQNYADGKLNTRLLYTSDLNSNCKLQVQPLEILANFEVSAPVSSLYTTGSNRISNTETVELFLHFDESFVQNYVNTHTADDQISHVLDWWPDTVDTRVGMHITSPMINAEHAPITFDSHYAFDPATYTIHYLHSALRDESLLTHTAGSGGLCRVHSIGMPIFETNTNRICTRMPKKGSKDSPHLPVDTPKTEANIPQMGPYDTSILNDYFEDEICATTYEEVPWPVTKNNSFELAGSIPSISKYLPMDENGKCTYSSDFFPPIEAEMLPVKDMYKDWGECSGSIVWDDSPPCSDKNAGAGCPRNSICLKKGNETSNAEGICFSSAAFRIDNSRPPCFRTDHCVDGLVCLADGGCSPLYFHMWNSVENNINSLEFTIMADDCGFQNPSHPFTQSMRGASAWEQVPDLLHKHGLCSHSNWFEYRNAFNDGVCPQSPMNADCLQCNLSQAVWPDVQMRFDGCRTSSLSSSTRFTMGQQYALHTIPHPCDRDYMHAAMQNHRLKVCSGYQGIEKGSYVGNYFVYELSDKGTWEGMPLEDKLSPDTVHWMRTYTESDSLLNMGNLLKGSKEKYDSRLGFLGAEKDSEHAVLQDMTIEDGVRFFRCTDRMACQMPEFSYGGVRMEYRLDLTAKPFSNFSETSLRRCGAIGSLLSANNICRLDAEMFPLFTYILKKENTFIMQEEGNGGTRSVLKGCLALWSKSKYTTNVISISFNSNNWDSRISLQLLQTQPSVLFCSNEEILCVYLARDTSVLSEDNRQDHVSVITDHLNSIFRDTSDILDNVIATHGALYTYECINLCSMEIFDYTLQIQSAIQERYNSSIASGFYMAFQLSMYEFPQQWFHQCMLSVLLSHVDNFIPKVDTKLMNAGTILQLPLWSSLGQMDYCAENIIRHKSGLYYILCRQKHPVYSFQLTATELLYNIRRIIREGIMEVSQLKLYEKQGKSNVECYRDAAWKCDHANSNDKICSNALLHYYSIDGCVDISPNLCDIMALEVHYLTRIQEIPLSELSAVTGTSSNMADFLFSSTKYIETNADQQVLINDFVTSLRYDTETTDDYVTLATVKPIDTSMFSSFVNTGEWLHNTCLGGVHSDTCGAKQEDLPLESPCLFSEEDHYLDADRYFTHIEPVIHITVGATEYNINPCDFFSRKSYSYYINQYALDETLLEDDGPLITNVRVPPGIQVRAYSTNTIVPLQQWKDATISNNLPAYMINCAWNNGPEAWWPDAVGVSMLKTYGNGFDPYLIDFSDMGSWYTDATLPLWKSSGCGNSPGVYAIEFRVESLVVTNSFCSYAAPYPLTSVGYLATKPTCEFGKRPFRVANAISDYTLWRCAACTRFDPLIAKDGFFNCTLPGRVSMDNLFTTGMLQNTFDFLYSQQSLLVFVKEKILRYFTEIEDFQVREDTSTGFLKIMLSMKEQVIMSKLENWGGCTGREKLWDCNKGYDTSNTLQKEGIIWNKAVKSPLLLFTMACDGQKYTTEMQMKCNSNIDKKRRDLSKFVEEQYRQNNGVWLQKVQRGQGVSWKANMAHSAVNKFTLFYTSGDRLSDQVLSQWVLGDGPCSQTNSFLEDRICIESKLNNVQFEPLHPWIGGNFNPFAGNLGLDECPYISSTLCTTEGKTSGSMGSLVSMCPCACSPSWACEGVDFNYSKQFMDLEFPEDPICLMQKYSDTRVMNSNDPSNICSIVQKTVQSSSGCISSHGLLGGGMGASVSALGMHDKQGEVNVEDVPSQQMIESYTLITQPSPTIWSGQKYSKGIPFLKMSREFIHPSHIAFGLDNTISSMPLVIKAISLLHGISNFSEARVDWVQDLKRQWVYSGVENNPNVKSIASLYPQLSKQNNTSGGDWSCPIRKYAFFAGNDNSFGPLTPNPVVAQSIYGLGGVHPLIKTEGPYPNLAPYFTTNGACFFREDPSTWPRIAIDDVENQCGLRGIIKLLTTQMESLTSVQESFSTRCNDIIDAPDVGGTMRSGEILNPIPGLKQSCGVLHRITPALLSTKGDKGNVQIKSPLLTTTSVGGDCHMGRALKIDIGLLQGKRCSVVSKDTDDAYNFMCSGKTYKIFKSKPLTIAELLSKKTVLYREDTSTLPSFTGPVDLRETSFGLLYSASLKETLANDLIHVCKYTSGCKLKQNTPWTGAFFLQDYINGSLLENKPIMRFINDPLIDSNKRLYQHSVAHLEAMNLEYKLWNESDWTWSFLDHTKAPQGNVNKTLWTQNRTAACSASFQIMREKANSESVLKDSVRRISLCAPPPTGDMGDLCNAMTEHQKEIVQKNCQLYGNGDCISNMGMFYLPYMWSSTNQEYAFNRVSDYYKQTILTKFYDSTSLYDELCSSAIDASILTTLASISMQQNALCPASSLEVFKDMLSALKNAGHDLLYMAYTQLMMVANIIASVFTMSQGKDGSFYLETALRYMMELFAYIAKILIPLLDIMIQAVTTISPIGKLMSDILNLLCEMYNWIMKEIIIQVWCHFIRPVVIGILKAVKALVFVSSTLVDKIQDVLNYVGDGTENTCVSFYNARALSKCPGNIKTNANITDFQPQPMATLCWANDGGGGIYTGVTQSLLSCTSSDTCAKDPLLFDDASRKGLTYCGSCPSTHGGNGLTFGCDTYLQRCVCGILDNSKTECTKNYDCSVPKDSMCGISSKIEGIRNSYISVPCGSCGGMGMDPICMIDGQGPYGVCGCASVMSSLMVCSRDQIGKTTLALFSTELCLTILDTFKQNLIKNTMNIQTISLDFSEIAVTSCSLGTSNLCMDVSVPFSSSLGDLLTPLVVIVKLLSIIQPLSSTAGRRLLSDTDLLAHTHAEHDNQSQLVFNEWVPHILEHNASIMPCKINGSRQDTKRCLHSFAMAKYVVDHFNLSEMRGKEHTLMAVDRGPLSAIWTLRMYADRKGLLPFILDQDPFTKLLPKRLPNYTMWPSLEEGMHARKLLFATGDIGDWSFQCKSIQKPIDKIIKAFWTTVHFYERGPSALIKDTNSTNCSMQEGFTSCIGYSIPSSSTQNKDSVFQMISNAVLYAPTLGMGAERVFDAIISPMDYADSVSSDVITGKRILYDMSICNHTQITFGGMKDRSFMAIFIGMVILFHIVATMCMPLSCCQWALWYFIFPILFFWAMYNTSPLCWPMVPTTFIHDINSQVSYYLPQEIKIPKFLVKPHCTLTGKLPDGSYDSSCFSKCSDPPFLFVSWQDSIIWWVCEASTEYCLKMGDYLSSFGSLFKDMISSADYYASVIKYSSNDPEFVQAHRICAFVSLYQIIFFLVTVLFTCYLIPIVLSGIMEAFMGCVVLLMDTYSAEML